MIPIVEDYLSDLIQSKFSYLKSNPSILPKVLGTSPDRINRLVKYLGATPINVVKGYPRTPAQLPCICIMLSSEEEAQEGLGNYGEDEDSDIQEYSEELIVSTRRDGILVPPYVKTLSAPLASISQVIHNGYSIHLEDYEYSISNPDLGIVEFTGDVEDGDSLTVTYTYRASSTELTQVLYDANYRLECWALNGDLTVELYHLLKWALLSGRDHLGKDKDLFQQRLGGADFEPATSYFPEFVYRRALTFWCQFTASSPEDTYEYITGIETNQEEYSNNFGGDDNG